MFVNVAHVVGAESTFMHRQGFQKPWFWYWQMYSCIIVIFILLLLLLNSFLYPIIFWTKYSKIWNLKYLWQCFRETFRYILLVIIVWGGRGSKMYFALYELILADFTGGRVYEQRVDVKWNQFWSSNVGRASYSTSRRFINGAPLPVMAVCFAV